MVLEQDPVYPGAQVENHNILRHIFGGALAPIIMFKDAVSGQLKKTLPLICSYLAGLIITRQRTSLNPIQFNEKCYIGFFTTILKT